MRVSCYVTALAMAVLVAVVTFQGAGPEVTHRCSVISLLLLIAGNTAND